VFNAFLHKGNTPSKTPTGRLASYLNLDKAVQESKADENNVAGTDNGASSTKAPSTSSSSTTTPETTSPTTTTTTPATTTPASPQIAKAETVYTVKEGDTYGCIAEKYYGSYEQYADVMAANPVHDQGFGEYSLYEGAQLVLPAVSKDNLKPASALCQ
jgi:LysM repeat protein